MRPCLLHYRVQVHRRILRWPPMLPPAAVFLLLLTAAAPYSSGSEYNGSIFGYSCNLSAPAVPCTAYLTFRSTPPFYTSPVSVAYHLNANASAVAAANNITLAAAVVPVPNKHMFVPVPCSCTSSGYYQHNTTYVVQPGDGKYHIAKVTFQDLSTHQAIDNQNPNYPYLIINSAITVPLRCACPSAQQAAAGFRYLVTYPYYSMGENNDDQTVSRRFRVDPQAIRDANRLYSGFSNTLLVPLRNPPSPDMLASLDPPAPPAAVLVNHCWPGGHWLIDVGVGSGCGVVVSAVIVTLSLSWQRRRRRQRLCGGAFGKVAAVAPLVAAACDTVDSLTVYTYMELGAATAGFAEERRVAGTAVYRAVINGQAFAVKRVSGDVRGEVGVLSRVNHSCLVRLAGICAHSGDTYLVLEFAENGALGGLLHGGGGAARLLVVLNWKQRVQVASDVASGLNYLHHFTNPPYVHKNLNTGNVLLDAKFRAKVSNLGLARAVAAGTGGGVGVQATRHVVGTHRYLAPEYLEHGLISTQMDVFAFGVILLELLSGKEAVFVAADGHNASLLWEAAEGMIDGDEAWFRLKEFMDPRLQGHYPFGLASTMAALALRCVAREPRARPSMDEVLVLVSAVHDATVDWDPQNYGVSDSMLLGR